jgi:predicted ester cyclase
MKGKSKLLLVVLALGLFVMPVFAQEDALEANKAIAVAWWEAEAAHEYERMGEFFTEDVVRHSLATSTVMPETQVTNLEEYTLFLQGTAAMVPDYIFTPQMVAAEGDFVAWYGVFSGTFAENGNLIEVPLAGFFRFEDGKIAEIWTEWDNITWGAQMNEGAPPSQVAAYEPPIAGDFDVEANRSLFETFAEAERAHSYDRFDQLVADDFVRHSAATPDVRVNSRDAFIAYLEETTQAFPDYINTAQMIVAENDLVAVYAEMSATFAETDREVAFPFIAFFRVEDDKLAELWVEWDNLTVLAQMGVLPPS